MEIPFNKIYYTGNEEKYIKDVLKRKHLAGDGYYTKCVNSLLQEKFAINKLLMTTSGTHALEMAAALAGVGRGDEVIMPSFTFSSTANAVLNRGAKPVFAEIKEETLNIDPQDIKRKITEKTKAILVVHYAGIACEMDKIMEIAREEKLLVIEDAAQGVNAKYKNRYLGTCGDIGCFSFHESKNYISGEGGALILNTAGEELCRKAEIIREKGTNRTEFMRGEIDKYTWVDEGSSYLPSELLMALLLAQLEAVDEIKDKREVIYKYYSSHLQKYLAADFLVSFSRVPAECEANYHIFYLVFKNNNIREKVRRGLEERGISAYFHYIPLHSSPMGKKLGYKREDLSLTEWISSSLLRLPLYTGMTKQEREYVINSLEEIFKEL